MLATLRIKNLALVDDLTIEFSPGFNAITGETGAGKSILIGALNLAVGGRADRTLIRSGADSGSVEAVFEPGDSAARVDAVLDAHGVELCEAGRLIVRRIVTAAGAGRQFVNGSPVTLGMLKQLGEVLVDIHGPHDHQSLLHGGRQLVILDALGGLEPGRAELSRLLARRSEVEAAKGDLVVDEGTYARQLDLLRHQVAEIEGAGFQPGEEEELGAAHTRAGNAARLLELAQAGLSALGDSDGALLDHAAHLGRLLLELERIDPSAAGLGQLHEQAIERWSELQTELGRYADRVEVDPGRLAELEERLNLLQSLKRKYGGSVGEINRFGTEAREKLRVLESRDAELARLNAELTRIGQDLQTAAASLTTARKKLVPKLSRAVTDQLRELGFARSHFEISLAAAGVLSASGADTCDFQFAPNVGEPPRPLRSIASSGELARVMLALKTVLAAQDQIPVLVFDEVDANVGGETATVVGRKMAEIGKRRQVLCVTHLPAVAAAARTHFEVRKEVQNGRTLSFMQMLEGRSRTEELTRMLGGGSDAARRHAEELLAAASTTRKPRPAR
jgi:DNA repair protein RecN (Recombination protein N)